ncbi:glucan endo-1,3-beta-glucosidase-like [Papaver somniferum]|uniref:glucan endo-1,3-beta-glucosidase-like n=1 Tax=Papaver somniferum TaxID=3469 RepID=UPI000E6F8B61|nr:glucan endo-1,3-beta-glucosidase-like [Papaver somniferum]
MIPTNVSKYVLQAIINMNTAVHQSGSPQSIKVTTVVAMGVLGTSYPPSAAVFSNDSLQIMRGIVSFLQNQGFPFFLNVYPYFSYASNPSKIRLVYALFDTTDVVVQDGNLQYKNLFYAMVDSMIWAVEKAGGSNV